MAGIPAMGAAGGFSASASSSASGRLDQVGNGFDLGSGGAWNVNIGGRGTSYQGAAASATSGMPTWLIVGAALGAAWLLLRK